MLEVLEKVKTKWNRNEESAKCPRAIWLWQGSLGLVPQLLFVLPMGKISGLSLNIFHKLNVTFSLFSNAVSSYYFWTSGIPKAFSKNGSCETNYFKKSAMGVTSLYFVTQMCGPVHCTELRTNSILLEHSSLARIEHKV